MSSADYEGLGGQLYDALREVQMALFHGEDEDDKQIEAALQAWERRHMPARIDGDAGE
jgi:hypothetical protein